MPRPPAAKSAGEFGRIDRYLKPLAAGFPGALGLTDDAAVFGIPADRELVITTDALVAGVHFLPDDPPADIAAKLLRVNLSDLAAMAADPLAYLTGDQPAGGYRRRLAGRVRGRVGGGPAALRHPPDGR